MTAGDQYLIRAAELDTKAASEANNELRSELETLARAYRRLAEQAYRNAEIDLGPEGSAGDPSDHPSDQC